MSKESLEHLSSLMDGEISREAGLFLTRRLSSDDEMCETWERYHLIRDCIRQPGSKQFVSGLSVTLNASLDAEEMPSVSPWRTRRWLKPVSGLAIAASVAMVAIVVTAPQQGELPGSGDMALSAPVNQPFVSPNNLPITPVTQAASYTQADSNYLNAYLLRHNQMAKTAGKQGFVSFVSIVATPTVVAENTAEEGSKSAELGSEPEAVDNQ